MSNYYKPLLGNRLEFPPGFTAVWVGFAEHGCHFQWYQSLQNAVSHAAALLPNTEKRQAFIFFSFDEILNALQGPEKENRQLHVMADLISWYCVGPGPVEPLKGPQIELFT